MSENVTRQQGLIALIVIGIVVIGGFLVVNNVDFSAFGAQEEVIVDDSVCVDLEDQAFETVCGTQEEVDSALRQMGIDVDEDVTFTVMIGTLEVTGTYAEIEAFRGQSDVVQAEATPVPIEEVNSDDEAIVGDPVVFDGRYNNDNVIIVGEDAGFAYDMFYGFENRAVPAYGIWNREQTNTFIPDTGYILGSPGVIGTHSLREANSNDSAVLITSNQEILDNTTATQPLFEGGYMMVSASTVNMEFAGYGLDLPAIDFHEYIVVLRGNYNADNADMNIPVHFSDYDDGFIMVTTYAVPNGAGGFMSDEYVMQNVLNSFDTNCGLGDCGFVTLIVVDVNSGAYTMTDYVEDGEWVLESTNVPTRYR